MPWRRSVPAEPQISPCTGVCQLDATQTCVGCRRSLAEIQAWPRLSLRHRDRIWRRIRQEQAEAGRIRDH